MKTLVYLLTLVTVAAIASAIMTACLPPTSPANVEADASEAKKVMHELCTLRVDQLEMGAPDSPRIPPALYRRLDAACLIVDGTPMPPDPSTAPKPVDAGTRPDSGPH